MLHFPNLAHSIVHQHRKIKTNGCTSDTSRPGFRGWTLRRGFHFPRSATANDIIVGKKMFLSDHSHVYSVLTFCLASGMKKMMRNVCTVFIYRCWSLCKLFSCWFFVALPFFPCAADESRQSSQNGLKIVKTTSECAIKQMRRFLRHRNGNSRCWDFLSFPEDNRRPRHKQTPSSDLFTAFRRQFITSLRVLICDYSWIFHVFTLKFQLELSIRREAPWIINLNLFKFSFPFRFRKFASQDLLFLSWWHRLCVEKILLTLFRREVRVGVSNDH